jgi:Small metal-binding protein
MNSKFAVAIATISLALSGNAIAAGGPMNEDLTSLAAPAQKAIEAGKAGNAAVFQAEAEAALKEAKEKTDSAAQQRVSGKLKRAIEAGKNGDLATGTQLIEESMRDMKKAGAPQFGGGN